MQIKIVLYLKIKGFVDIKTNIWIDLFCGSAYFLALWLSCRDSSALLFRSKISFICWSSCPDTSIICSPTSFLISVFSSDFAPKSEKKMKSQYNHLGMHFTYFCKVLIWFVILPSADPSGSGMDISCVWGELSICGTVSTSFSITLSTSGIRKYAWKYS